MTKDRQLILIEALYRRQRKDLEWCVYEMLTQDDPLITFSKGGEMLGFVTMDLMREWYRNYKPC